jgi:hypothetical protein
VCSQKTEEGAKGLMHLEEAYVVEITTVMECLDNNEDPVIQTVRTHQHNTASATLHTAISLKTELHRGTRQIKDIIAEKMKERWRGKSMLGQFQRNLDENWWVMNRSVHH